MADGYEFEGLWRRFVAALIDNLGWLLFFFFYLGQIGVAIYDADAAAGTIFFFVFATAWFNYFALCEWRWGQTIGKNVMGMRVISTDRGKITYGQSSIRNLLRLVDFFVIGWVMIATGEKRQRLGDKAANTVVVRNPNREEKHYGERPPSPRPEAEPSTAEKVAAATATDSATAGAAALPTIRWGVSDTVWSLIAGLLLAGLIAPLLVLPFDPQLDSDAALLGAQALFATALIVVAVGTASRWSFSPLGDALTSLGLRSVGLKAFGLALLTLLVYYLAAGLFSVLVLDPEQDDIAGELGVNDPNLLVAISAIVLIAIVAPISEELFFRGMVFAGLRLRFSLWPAAIISGVIFGLPHIFTGPLAVIPLSALGVALAWLYERTGSLWPCVFAHAINNSLALAVAS
jgi:membrane protease YdiL (CAAX protease family)/uncharacterized RDD family membrane protein YckC